MSMMSSLPPASGADWDRFFALIELAKDPKAAEERGKALQAAEAAALKATAEANRKAADSKKLAEEVAAAKKKLDEDVVDRSNHCTSREVAVTARETRSDEREKRQAELDAELLKREQAVTTREASLDRQLDQLTGLRRPA